MKIPPPPASGPVRPPLPVQQRTAETARNTAAAVNGKTPGAAAAPPRQTLFSALPSLGLPADRLSAAIVSFARFFSLPLEPGLLMKVRRQAIVEGQTPPPGQAEKPVAPGQAAETPVHRSREALALAALAAADKGLELTAAGLEDYAAAIDPERRGRGQGSKKRREQQADNEALAGGVSGLKNRVLEAAEQDPLLDLLNRLPGKNGRRWITLPFEFTTPKDQYRLSLRILADEGNAANTASSMALDIVRAGDFAAPEQRWLFVLDRGHGKIARLKALLWPPRPERETRKMVQDLSVRLDLSPGCIRVQNSGEPFPFAAENREDLLLSINKEV